MATTNIGARIDHCNSVRYVSTERNLNCLQKVQNAMVRIVYQAFCQTSATASRQQLHWLLIRQRITYKLATLTFREKYCRTPVYLHEPLRDHQVARTLRSTTAPLFYRPFVSTVFTSRAFYYSAPQVWNCLGTSTRSANTFSSFRRCLKSELFAAAYDTYASHYPSTALLIRLATLRYTNFSSIVSIQCVCDTALLAPFSHL